MPSGRHVAALSNGGFALLEQSVSGTTGQFHVKLYDRFGQFTSDFTHHHASADEGALTASGFLRGGSGSFSISYVVDSEEHTYRTISFTNEGSFIAASDTFSGGELRMQQFNQVLFSNHFVGLEDGRFAYAYDVLVATEIPEVIDSHSEKIKIGLIDSTGANHTYTLADEGYFGTGYGQNDYDVYEIVRLSNGYFAVTYNTDFDIKLAVFDPDNFEDTLWRAFIGNQRPTHGNDFVKPPSLIVKDGSFIVVDNDVPGRFLEFTNWGATLRPAALPGEGAIPVGATSESAGRMTDGRVVVLDDSPAGFHFEDGRGSIIRGGASDDVIVARDAGGAVFGEAGNDQVYGRGGADTLAGGEGNDSLDGGAGDDPFVFDAPDVNGATNVAWGGSGFDTLALQGGANAVSFDLADLARLQLSSIEAIAFGPADHTGKISVQFNTDRFAMAGGLASNLKLFGSNAAEEVRIGLNGATGFSAAGLQFSGWNEGRDRVFITGGAAGEGITGSAVADIINSGGGNDSVRAGAGRDSVNAGAGNDVITLEAGDLASAGETMDGSTGSDILRIRNMSGAAQTFDLRPHTLLGIERFEITGNAATRIDLNYATLSSLQPYVFDTTDGTTAARRTIVVNAETAGAIELLNISATLRSQDVFTYQGGNGATQNFNGRAFAETFYAAGGADTVAGNGGDDIVYGEAGNDRLNGNAGRDKLYGGADNDVLLIGSLSDFVAGEVYDGGSEMDTLEIGGGGVYDFSGATIASIERL